MTRHGDDLVCGGVHCFPRAPGVGRSNKSIPKLGTRHPLLDSDRITLVGEDSWVRFSLKIRIPIISVDQYGCV
jgi:hypothetical protein